MENGIFFILEGSLASLIFFSGKSDMQPQMCMEQWCNGAKKVLARKPVPFQLFPSKFNTD